MPSVEELERRAGELAALAAKLTADKDEARRQSEPISQELRDVNDELALVEKELRDERVREALRVRGDGDNVAAQLGLEL